MAELSSFTHDGTRIRQVNILRSTSFYADGTMGFQLALSNGDTHCLVVNELEAHNMIRDLISLLYFDLKRRSAAMDDKSVEAIAQSLQPPVVTK